MEHIKKILEELFNVEIKPKLKQKGRKIMSEEKTKKKSYVCYVYGQIYDGYLRSGKQKVFLIENVHVREWKNILNWLKKNEHIGDFALGETIEDAAKLIVKEFNEENKIYPKYLAGVEKKIKESEAKAA